MISAIGRRKIVSLVNSSNSAPVGEARNGDRMVIPPVSSRSGKAAAPLSVTRSRVTLVAVGERKTSQFWYFASAFQR